MSHTPSYQKAEKRAQELKEEVLMGNLAVDEGAAEKRGAVPDDF